MKKVELSLPNKEDIELELLCAKNVEEIKEYFGNKMYSQLLNELDQPNLDSYYKLSCALTNLFRKVKTRKELENKILLYLAKETNNAS
jgi:hypothetical protein